MDSDQQRKKKLSCEFSDSSSFDEEHIPLNTCWTFWINNAEKGYSMEEYEAKLQKIYSVTTVQKFWSVFNHIPDIKDLKNKYSYHLMREERRPVWEDEDNQSGGAWHLKVLKKDSEVVWKELLLAAIGEQFVDYVKTGDNICGVTITVRDRDDVVQIWNTNASEEPQGIIEKVHKLLPNVQFLTEYYRAHRTHTSYDDSRKGAYEL